MALSSGMVALLKPDWRLYRTRIFNLTEHPNIEVKEKVYGVHDSKVKKVIHAFEIFERSLGTILSGDKGIGKSIFAKRLCQKAIEKLVEY